MDSECEQQVAAETHERLLPNGNEARITGKQVPVLSQRQHREKENEIVDEVAAGEAREGQQKHKNKCRAKYDPTRAFGRNLDPVSAMRQTHLGVPPMPEARKCRLERRATQPLRLD